MTENLPKIRQNGDAKQVLRADCSIRPYMMYLPRNNSVCRANARAGSARCANRFVYNEFSVAVGYTFHRTFGRASPATDAIVTDSISQFHTPPYNLWKQYIISLDFFQALC